MVQAEILEVISVEIPVVIRMEILAMTAMEIPRVMWLENQEKTVQRLAVEQQVLQTEIPGKAIMQDRSLKIAWEIVTQK